METWSRSRPDLVAPAVVLEDLILVVATAVGIITIVLRVPSLLLKASSIA